MRIRAARYGKFIAGPPTVTSRQSTILTAMQKAGLDVQWARQRRRDYAGACSMVAAHRAPVSPGGRSQTGG
jgi:hypothetical protein